MDLRVALAERDSPLYLHLMRRTLLTLVLLFSASLPAIPQAPVPAGASFEVGFSPGGTALVVVEKAISAARSEILMACYDFTNREIAAALVAAERRGVRVEIVADWKASRDRGSQIAVLETAGIPVRMDRRYAIEHDKYMVIDRTDVETGSFNYTAAAVKDNAENALVIWNVPQLAKAYADEWQRLWGESG